MGGGSIWKVNSMGMWTETILKILHCFIIFKILKSSNDEITEVENVTVWKCLVDQPVHCSFTHFSVILISLFFNAFSKMFDWQFWCEENVIYLLKRKMPVMYFRRVLHIIQFPPEMIICPVALLFVWTKKESFQACYCKGAATLIYALHWSCLHVCMCGLENVGQSCMCVEAVCPSFCHFDSVCLFCG